ncbi:YmfQ family protein [Salinarimonas soli]|uniref:DUF2313 domain-containing protein n=1 Tax=Salinarimonas soli TaxID=1638099 RepID=A0A5B2V883_9HYPH|nr:putative phage tail protein [Salinarimonas soli]KAA2235254.1 DUF2313 domain-containing protein [Salinarimonas soli]
MPEPSGFQRRDRRAYAHAFRALMTRGPAWPTNPDSVLAKLLEGLSEAWELVDGRAADLLEREADPRAALEILGEWERAFGLPDPCVTQALTIGERQQALVARMTLLGEQSRGFFLSIADALGYQIEIREYSPFMVGASQVGDTQPTGAAGEPFTWELGAPEMRFYWTVRVGATRLTWFRLGGGGGQVGVDPHLRISTAIDLECVFRRLKPAHTEVIFSYDGLGIPNPMAGTP